MSQSRKEYFESQGYKVFDGYDATLGKTFTYVTHPEHNLSDPHHGQTLKYFSSLMDINHYSVLDGEYVDLDWYSWPNQFCPAGFGYSSQNEEYYETMDANGNKLIDPILGGLIVVAVAAAIFITVTMVVQLIKAINAPCGWGKIIPINECWKIIIAPDCSKAEFNACGGPDENGDGIPDGQWAGAPPGESGTPTWTKDIWEPTETVKWVVIGAIAIGAVVIAVKLMGGKQSSHAYYPPPPQEPSPEPRREPSPESTPRKTTPRKSTKKKSKK